MNTPPPRDTSAEALAELVQAMHNMRDALLQASLLLQDHQFEHDKTGRNKATELSDALIDRNRPR